MRCGRWGGVVSTCAPMGTVSMSCFDIITNVVPVGQSFFHSPDVRQSQKFFNTLNALAEAADAAQRRV
jgi:hypothetical protein